MEFFNALWKYLLIASPYLLGGLLVGGMIHTFITVERIKKLLGSKSFATIFKAAFWGIPLPLCSCSVIPTAITLRKSGASNGATASFLIATPESGVDSIAMTYAMMDLPMTILRPLSAFLSAITAGILHYFFNQFEVEEEADEVKTCCGSHKANASLGQKFKDMFRYAFVTLIDDMAFWLAFGIILGASIEYFLPPDVFTMLNGLGGRIAILAASIPMYICASATTPIAASLILKGMSPGSALLILLTGPATNVANIMVLQKYIGKKGILINILSIGSVALIMSYVVDMLYEKLNLPLVFNIEIHAHGEQVAGWQIATAIILAILIVKGVIMKEIIPRFSKEKCH